MLSRVRYLASRWQLVTRAACPLQLGDRQPPAQKRKNRAVPADRGPEPGAWHELRVHNPELLVESWPLSAATYTEHSRGRFGSIGRLGESP